MKTQIISIHNTNLELAKDFLTNEANVEQVLNQIYSLKEITADLSTQEGVDTLKKLKKDAAKFVKDLKSFCEPLEADGKKISDARSKITSALLTGKYAIIEQLLEPLTLAEDKLKELRIKTCVPLNTYELSVSTLEEVNKLKEFNWLIHKTEALAIIDNLEIVASANKAKFEEQFKLEAEMEEKERLEREEKIRIEATEKAKRDIEIANQRAAQIEENNKKLAEARIKAEAEAKEKAESDRIANVDHQKKIHNEILGDIRDILLIEEELAKRITIAIAKGQIRNLKIIY